MTTSLSDWIVSGVRLGERGSRSAARRQPGPFRRGPNPFAEEHSEQVGHFRLLFAFPLRLDGLLVHARLRIAEVDVPVEVEVGARPTMTPQKMLLAMLTAFCSAA